MILMNYDNIVRAKKIIPPGDWGRHDTYYATRLSVKSASGLNFGVYNDASPSPFQIWDEISYTDTERSDSALSGKTYLWCGSGDAATAYAATYAFGNAFSSQEIAPVLGELTHDFSHEAENNTTWRSTVTATFENISGSAITVKEVGVLMPQKVNRNGKIYDVLLAHEVLANAIEVAAGAQFTITFEYVMPVASQRAQQ